MNKTVFITGASEGLGRSFAGRLAKEGYTVTAVARNKGRLESLINELNSESPKQENSHRYLVADLATNEGQAICMEELKENNFNVLINNAGISQFGTFEDSNLEAELAILKVNIESTVKLSHCYLNNAQQGDAIINLSSLTYYLPTPIQPSYTASKNWIASFSESLWFQSKSKGVYVQGLCPGVAKTEFIDRAGEIKHKGILDFISVSPETVVDASFKALQKRKGPIVLPTIMDKFIVIVINLLPRRYSVWLMGKIGNLAL